MQTEKPTLETYSALLDAFDHFNQDLFEGRLEPVVFVFLRKPGSQGSFQAAAWQRRSGPGDQPARADDRDLAPQVTLNPDFLLTHGELEVLATLVHQQVHQLQHQAGKPSRSTYHNAEWADMAEAVGLQPTATGRPGGPRTGQKMEHLVVPDGRFERAALALLGTGWDFQWEARPEGTLTTEEPESGGAVGEEEPDEPLPSKLAYRCPQCGIRAWAKPETNLMCGGCLAHLIPQTS